MKKTACPSDVRTHGDEMQPNGVERLEEREWQRYVHSSDCWLPADGSSDHLCADAEDSEDSERRQPPVLCLRRLSGLQSGTPLPAFSGWLRRMLEPTQPASAALRPLRLECCSADGLRAAESAATVAAPRLVTVNDLTRALADPCAPLELDLCGAVLGFRSRSDEDCGIVHHVDVVRPGTVLKNATIHLRRGAIMRVAADCTLENVTIKGRGIKSDWIMGYQHDGLLEIGSDSSASSIRVTLKRVTVLNSKGCNGVRVRGNSTVDLHQCTVGPCGWNGLVLLGTGVRVRASRCVFAGNRASGLWALGSAHCHMTGCEMRDNRFNGAAAWDHGTRLLADGCRLQGNRANGLRVLQGGRAELRGCWVCGNHDQGIEVGDRGTLVSAQQCSITDNMNRGIFAYEGAYARLQACKVSGNQGEFQVQVQDRITSVAHSHCEIQGSVYSMHAR